MSAIVDHRRPRRTTVVRGLRRSCNYTAVVLTQVVYPILVGWYVVMRGRVGDSRRVTSRAIADALKRRREELGMTVVDAVRQTDVSRSTWRDLEAERRPGLSAPVGVKLDLFLDWPAGTTVRVFREGETDMTCNSKRDRKA